MKRVVFSWLLAGLTVSCLTGTAQAQRNRGGAGFDKAPGVGDRLPELTVYSPNGKEIKTSDLKGGYTVLTFGCLT